MRRALMLAGLVLVVLGGIFWLTGAMDGLGRWLAEAQRAAQDHLAGAIRALRGGEPGALATFWAVCFAYGVLHAAGPGHGKLMIGGYGLARRVPLGRLAGLALASSLAQAGVAVALVYLLVAALGLARGAVEGAAQDWLTPAGHAMIAGLGLWLVWRGARGLIGQGHSHHHPHDHHSGEAASAHCGHAHGPTLAQAAEVESFRDGLLLVAGIAVRPCAGALFVLILTWQLGIAAAGIAGALLMGLGTALLTVGVAVLSVAAREGAVSVLPGGRLARALPMVELALGAVIALAALALLLRAL
jgi:ABC-type nickel/cobalt efflux system permease component RcnA